MADYNLYRNGVFVRTETLPGDLRLMISIRHMRRFSLHDDVDPMLDGDCVEHFQYDYELGAHVSVNFRQLPTWALALVYKRLMEAAKEQARETFTQMLGG